MVSIDHHGMHLQRRIGAVKLRFHDMGDLLSVAVCMVFRFVGPGLSTESNQQNRQQTSEQQG